MKAGVLMSRVHSNGAFLCCQLALAACLATPAHAATATRAEPITPQFSNIEAGRSQVFSVRFRDAAGQPAVGETVRFGNDACGTFPNGGFSATTVTDAQGVGTITFTARTPGGITCWVTASSGSAAHRFDVLTYGINQVFISAVPEPARPQPGQPYRLTAAIMMWDYRIQNVDIAARIVSATDVATLSVPGGNSGLQGEVQFDVMPRALGDHAIELEFRGRTRRVAIKGTYQNAWWGGSAENGWGVALMQRGNTLVAGWYLYDSAGNATWLTMPPCTWNASLTTCSGTLYRASAAWFGDYRGTSFAQSIAGTATFTFTGAETAVMDYVVDGQRGQKTLGVLDVAAGAAPGAADYTDIWWGGQDQSGWGLALVQQRGVLVGVWYTYDRAGKPTWMLMNGGSWINATTFRGTLARATSSPVIGPTYDPKVFAPTIAGDITLVFSDANNAVMTYSVDGVTQTKAISRLPY